MTECSGQELKLSGEKGLVRWRGQLPEGTPRTPLSICLPLAGGHGSQEMVHLGERAHPSHTSSFLSHPPSSSSWHRFYFTFLLRVPAKSRGL